MAPKRRAPSPAPPRSPPPPPPPPQQPSSGGDSGSDAEGGEEAGPPHTAAAPMLLQIADTPAAADGSADSDAVHVSGVATEPDAVPAAAQPGSGGDGEGDGEASEPAPETVVVVANKESKSVEVEGKKGPAPPPPPFPYGRVKRAVGKAYPSRKRKQGNAEVTPAAVQVPVQNPQPHDPSVAVGGDGAEEVQMLDSPAAVAAADQPEEEGGESSELEPKVLEQLTENEVVAAADKKSMAVKKGKKRPAGKRKKGNAEVSPAAVKVPVQNSQPQPHAPAAAVADGAEEVLMSELPAATAAAPQPEEEGGKSSELEPEVLELLTETEVVVAADKKSMAVEKKGKKRPAGKRKKGNAEVSPAAVQVPVQNPQPHDPAAKMADGVDEVQMSDSPAALAAAAQPEEEGGESSELEPDVLEQLTKKAAVDKKSKAVENKGKKRPAGKRRKGNADVSPAAVQLPVQNPQPHDGAATAGDGADEVQMSDLPAGTAAVAQPEEGGESSELEPEVLEQLTEKAAADKKSKAGEKKGKKMPAPPSSPSGRAKRDIAEVTQAVVQVPVQNPEPLAPAAVAADGADKVQMSKLAAVSVDPQPEEEGGESSELEPQVLEPLTENEVVAAVDKKSKAVEKKGKKRPSPPSSPSGRVKRDTAEITLAGKRKKANAEVTPAAVQMPLQDHQHHAPAAAADVAEEIQVSRFPTKPPAAAAAPHPEKEVGKSSELESEVLEQLTEKAAVAAVDKKSKAVDKKGKKKRPKKAIAKVNLIGKGKEDNAEVTPAAAQVPLQNPQPSPAAAAANGAAIQLSSSTSKPAAAASAPQPESGADGEVGGELSQPVPEKASVVATSQNSKTVDQEGSKMPAPQPSPSGRVTRASAKVILAGKEKKPNEKTADQVPLPNNQPHASTAAADGAAIQMSRSSNKPAAPALQLEFSADEEGDREPSEPALEKVAVVATAKKSKIADQEGSKRPFPQPSPSRRVTRATAIQLSRSPTKLAAVAAAPQLESGADEEQLPVLVPKIPEQQLPEKAVTNQKGSKKWQGAEVRTNRNVKSKLFNEDITTAAHSKSKKQENEKEKLGKEVKSGTSKDTATITTQDGKTSEEEAHEEDIKRGAGVQRKQRSIEELQSMYPCLSEYMERLKAQHQYGEALMVGFGFIGDEKANVLETMLKDQRLSEMDAQLLQGVRKREAFNLVVGLAP